MREFRGERYVGDRYIVQNEIEPERAICEVLPHEPRDLHRAVQPSHYDICKERVTISRCVMSWLALNCATTLFKTSFTIDGRTRSSKSWPSSRYMVGSACGDGRDKTRHVILTICRSRVLSEIRKGPLVKWSLPNLLCLSSSRYFWASL